MKVLVACEFSEILKEQLLIRDNDAHSCDYLPGEKGLPNHHQCDVRELLKEYWDMIIAFPPCTDLAISGARWFKGKIADGRQKEAIDFFMLFANHPCEKISIEQPIGIMSTVYRKPDQIIQPWQFGHGEVKAICLWLKGLPKLVSTNIVDGRIPRVHREPPSPDRWKNRSRIYEGIAKAIAEQWG